MIDQHLREKQLDSETVFAGHLLHVCRDEVLLPNQARSVREYIKHPGAVIIIAFLDNGNLVFERQYRYPVQQVCLELPAGKIDPGEDILATGRRELLEETGYSADDWRHLGGMHPCIGYSDERIDIFLARGLHRVGAQRLDDNEFLDVVEMSLEAAVEAVRTGLITDGKTIVALYWAEKIQSAGW